MSIGNIFHRIKLASGITIPLFGLGGWDMIASEVESSVRHALSCGYRLFDTAALYKYEDSVGEALKESGLKRDEYFVVTKLSPDMHGYGEAKMSLKTSLQNLGLDYVDLFLIHTPKPGKNVESWRALCELKRDGFTKSIGVSNYNVQHLEGLLASGLEVPEVNQIEFHPWYQQNEAVEYCLKKNIAVMGYCPLARGRVFKDGLYPLIDELSNKHKKSKAQILLRWALQKGVITIPKSSNPERLKENSQLYDFELSEEDMNRMKTLDEEMHISIASSVMQTPWNG